MSEHNNNEHKGYTPIHLLTPVATSVIPPLLSSFPLPCSEQGTQVDISQNTDVVQIKKHSRKSKRSEGKDGDEGKGDDGEYDDDDYADEAGEGDEHNASKLLDFLQTVTPSMLSEVKAHASIRNSDATVLTLLHPFPSFPPTSSPRPSQVTA